MDIMFHIMPCEFRYKNGESVGFIPDTGNAGLAVDLPTATAIGGADFGHVTSTVTNNNNFNSGFLRRKNLYNYTVADDATMRDVEIFVPFNLIFGFMSSYDKLLKFMKWEITLLRAQQNNYTNIALGGAGSGIHVGQEANTGSENLYVQLEEYLPRPEIHVDINKKLSKPIDVTYLAREIYSIDMQISDKGNYR